MPIIQVRGRTIDTGSIKNPNLRTIVESEFCDRSGDFLFKYKEGRHTDQSGKHIEHTEKYTDTQHVDEIRKKYDDSWKGPPPPYDDFMKKGGPTHDDGPYCDSWSDANSRRTNRYGGR